MVIHHSVKAVQKWMDSGELHLLLYVKSIEMLKYFLIEMAESQYISVIDFGSLDTGLVI